MVLKLKHCIYSLPNPLPSAPTNNSQHRACRAKRVKQRRKPTHIYLRRHIGHKSYPAIAVPQGIHLLIFPFRSLCSRNRSAKAQAFVGLLYRVNHVRFVRWRSSRQGRILPWNNYSCETNRTGSQNNPEKMVPLCNAVTLHGIGNKNFCLVPGEKGHPTEGQTRHSGTCLLSKNN